MRTLLAALAWLALIAAPAHGDAMEDALAREIRTYALPGPRADETRQFFVWRPAGVSGELPVVYVADGLWGIRMLIDQLHGPMARGEAQPFMIVGIEALTVRRHRTREYVPYESRANPHFEAHRQWVVDSVIPFVEATQRASRERATRFIAGGSNGADFASAMAARHPDLFGGVLAHAAMNPRSEWGEGAAEQRWVITAARGMAEEGYALALARRVRASGATPRVCIGHWDHHPEVWRSLSAGAMMWLLGDEAAAERLASGRERTNCYIFEAGG